MRTNLLLLRLDRLGDLIQTLPAIRAFQGSAFQVKVAVNPLYLDLVEGLYDFSWVGLSPASFQADQDPVRAWQIEKLVNFSHERNSALILPKLRYVPERYGNINSWKSFFLYNHRIFQKRSWARYNEAEYCFDLIERFKLLPSPARTRPMLLPKPAHQTKIDAWLQKNKVDRFLVFHIGMGGSALNASLGFYRELLIKVLARGHKVLLTGSGAKEAENNQSLLQACRDSKVPADQVYDLANQFDLGGLAALYAKAELVLAPSTGPLHLANAVGAKIVGIYSPILVQSKVRWAPFLAKGHVFSPEDFLAKLRCPAQKKCLGKACSFYFCMDQFSSLHTEKLIRAIEAEL